jgi:hypothetical protein
MAKINSLNVNVPGQNPRQINEVYTVGLDTECNEYNGCDITNPWREFTKDEWWRQLGKKGQMIVEAKQLKSNSSQGGGYRGGHRGQGGGRGGGRFGRGGQGGRGGADNSNNDN